MAASRNLEEYARYESPKFGGIYYWNEDCFKWTHIILSVYTVCYDLVSMKISNEQTTNYNISNLIS